MRKLLVLSLTVIALLAMSSIAFAAPEKAVLDAGGLGLTAVGAAVGMGLAALGCGIGMGVGLKGACEGTARNPEVGNKITVTMILGFAFIESLAIYTLVIDMILLFANPFTGA